MHVVTLPLFGISLFSCGENNFFVCRNFCSFSNVIWAELMSTLFCHKKLHFNHSNHKLCYSLITYLCRSNIFSTMAMKSIGLS